MPHRRRAMGVLAGQCDAHAARGAYRARPTRLGEWLLGTGGVDLAPNGLRGEVAGLLTGTR